MALETEGSYTPHSMFLSVSGYSACSPDLMGDFRIPAGRHSEPVFPEHLLCAGPGAGDTAPRKPSGYADPPAVEAMRGPRVGRAGVPAFL